MVASGPCRPHSWTRHLHVVIVGVLSTTAGMAELRFVQPFTPVPLATSLSDPSPTRGYVSLRPRLECELLPDTQGLGIRLCFVNQLCASFSAIAVVAPADETSGAPTALDYQSNMSITLAAFWEILLALKLGFSPLQKR